MKQRAALLSLLLLGACGTDGPLLQKSAEPAKPTTAGPAASTSAAASPTAPKPGVNSAVQVGAKKLSIASAELDARCERVVAPFALTDNFDALWKLSLTVAGNTVSQTIEQMNTGPGATTAGNKGKAKQQGQKFKQTLPIELRQAAMRMNWLPMDMEVLYGQEQLKKLSIVERRGKALASYATADKLLAEVLAGVQEPHDYQFRIFVAANAGENAEALPGGLVVVDRALVDDPKLRNKAYFAVAHEVAHVLQRHQTRAVQARIIDSVALAGSVKGLIQAMRNTQGKEAIATVRVLIGGKLLFEKHASDQELQSDACAMRVLYAGFAQSQPRLIASVQAFANGLPPEPPAKIVKTAATAEDQWDALVDLVQRPVDAHPRTGERIGNLVSMLKILREGLAAESKPAVAPPKTAVKPLPTLADTKAGKT